MKDNATGSLDRRDFVIASLATVGASAAFAAAAGAADAQDKAASPRPMGTVYTGDLIGGKKVISALDVKDLDPGRKHAFYFQGVQMPTGQHWYVSVIVAKGAKPGKRIALVSGVHGDEISPVHTIQTVMDQLNPTEMSGIVLAVLDVSRPAIEGMSRRWPNSGRGIDLIDINREWPGNEDGASAPTRHAGLLFNRLLKSNADYAIDFHTSATGMDMSAFHLARMDLSEVREMAELFPIDQIFDNPGYPGLLANAFIDAGIPAFTPEYRGPAQWWPRQASTRSMRSYAISSSSGSTRISFARCSGESTWGAAGSSGTRNVGQLLAATCSSLGTRVEMSSSDPPTMRNGMIRQPRHDRGHAHRASPRPAACACAA